MTKEKHDKPVSFRLSKKTLGQLKELSEHWGENYARTIARTIQQSLLHEIINMPDSAAPEIITE